MSEEPSQGRCIRVKLIALTEGDVSPKEDHFLSAPRRRFYLYLRAYARQPARGPSKGLVAVVVVFLSLLLLLLVLLLLLLWL